MGKKVKETWQKIKGTSGNSLAWAEAWDQGSTRAPDVRGIHGLYIGQRVGIKYLCSDCSMARYLTATQFRSFPLSSMSTFARFIDPARLLLQGSFSTQFPYRKPGSPGPVSLPPGFRGRGLRWVPSLIMLRETKRSCPGAPAHPRCPFPLPVYN